MRFSDFQQKIEAFSALPPEKKADILAVAKNLSEEQMEKLHGRIAELHDKLSHAKEEGVEIVADLFQLTNATEHTFAATERKGAEQDERSTETASLDSLFNDA
jgi:hypothetical protein